MHHFHTSIPVIARLMAIALLSAAIPHLHADDVLSSPIPAVEYQASAYDSPQMDGSQSSILTSFYATLDFSAFLRLGPASAEQGGGTMIAYGMPLEVQVGLLWENASEEGRGHLFGGGLRAAYAPSNNCAAYRREEGTPVFANEGSSIELGISLFYDLPLDSDHRSAARLYGGLSAGFGDYPAYFLFDIGAAYVLHFGSLVEFHAGGSVDLKLGNGTAFGIRPLIGLGFRF